MSISKYNHEGYYDPTAYEALKSVTNGSRKIRRLVYICSPYAGDVEYNTSRAKAYCLFAVNRGCTPIAPHLLFPQFLNDNDKEERELGMVLALSILSRCNSVWVFGEKISSGMEEEIKRAKELNIHIRYYNNRCEVINHGV